MHRSNSDAIAQAVIFDHNVGNTSKPDQQYWKGFIKDSQLGTFKDQAYANEDGLAIRINPVTGKKELFVAGTRTGKEWLQNVVEGAGHAMPGVLGVSHATRYSELQRQDYADWIDQIVELEDIEVVYGHSRGAATMSEMHSEVQYIGVDGASFIGHHKDYINLQNTGVGGLGFDKLIGAGHKGNVDMPKTVIHDVTNVKGTLKRKKAIGNKRSSIRAKQRTAAVKKKSFVTKFKTKLKARRNSHHNKRRGLATVSKTNKARSNKKRNSKKRKRR